MFLQCSIGMFILPPYTLCDVGTEIVTRHMTAQKISENETVDILIGHFINFAVLCII